MKDVAARILDEALRLPAEAKAAIADSLLDSLYTAVDPDAEEAWQREIRDRNAIAIDNLGAQRARSRSARATRHVAASLEAVRRELATTPAHVTFSDR
jgi:hypothetical protein